MYNFDEDSEQVSGGAPSESAKYRGAHLIVMFSKRLPLVIKFNTDSYFDPIAQYG
jgi:hypothetical protein